MNPLVRNYDSGISFLVEKQRERLKAQIVQRIGEMAEATTDEMFGPTANDPSSVVYENTVTLHDQETSSEGLLTDEIKQYIRNTIHDEFASVLNDISYRIGVLTDLADRLSGKGNGRVTAQDLNLAVHLIEGYTFTDNSPNAGSIAWSDVHIQYQGTTYTVQDGNTDKKYIWWKKSSPTVFQTDDTKPTLTQDDVLVAINEGGKANILITPGKMVSGAAILDGTVNSGELANNSVVTAKIANNAVQAAKIANSAVTSNKIQDEAVTTNKILDSAVTLSKIPDNELTGAKLTDGAVTNVKLADSSVSGNKIANGGVTAGKIASGAINNSNLFANGVVSNAALAGNIEGAKLVDGAITAAKIGAGAVAAEKLNLAMHVMF